MLKKNNTKNLFPLVFILSLISLITISCNKVAQDHSYKTRTIIPLPEKITKSEGFFNFSSKTIWIVESIAQQEIAEQLTVKFKKTTGINPEILLSESKKSSSVVAFKTDSTLVGEGYRLKSTKNSITVEAATNAGFFYATQSIRQLLPPEIENENKVEGLQLNIPIISIEDKPRFKWRSYMLDVSRHFMPKDYVLDLIDNMAMHKLNKLHLHLVDNGGWRIEIKKYPKLTSVGSWRVKRDQIFTERPVPAKGEKTFPSGFYTQDDIKEIVAYASDRSIEVIPEIEMPAHTCSSLAAYPEFACPVAPKPINVIAMPSAEADKVYCAGNDKVFEFIEDVLTETMALFPSKYVHIGGDEASRKYWKECPLCQKRIKDEHLKNEEDLQGYFIRRIGKFLKSKNKQLVGWDEITFAEMPDDAIVMGWRGNGKDGYKAGKMGHEFIMTPAKSLYFIRYQGPQWFEPETYFGNTTLKDVYDYEPLQDTIYNDIAHKLLGVQGCLWTEFVTNPKEADYMSFPRLDALSELAWTPKGTKDWNGFIKRIDNMLPRYDVMGVNYAKSMYNIEHQVKPINGALQVEFSTIRPDDTINYTVNSTVGVYDKPIIITEDTAIKAIASVDENTKGKELAFHLKFNKATAKQSHLSGSLNKKGFDSWQLQNGLRGSLKHSDGEWVGMYNEDITIDLDLEEKTQINSVSLGAIHNYGMRVNLPSNVQVSVSNDGKTYRIIGNTEKHNVSMLTPGFLVKDLNLKGINTKARYVRLHVTNPGPCIKGHIKEGTPSWVKFDEIIIE